MEKLTNIVHSFKGKRIGVIGDLMLDQFIFGQADRISPEAPVPIVLFSKEVYILGGAANTANNIASLGGEVFLVGVIGKDVAGENLLKQLNLSGINRQGVIVLEEKSTTQKIRVVAQGQHIVRIDKEQVGLINRSIEKKVIDIVDSQIKNWDMVVISDYNKGFVTKKLVADIIKLAKKYNKKIIADIKPANSQYFKNIFLLTPNQKEAFLISGAQDVKIAGKIIQKKMHCNVLVKQGSGGMTLFEKDNVSSFPTLAKEVFDVSGAGDTVLATMSLAICSGASLKQAVIIANHAAGISVAKVGTAIVLPEELIKDLEHE